MLKVRIAEMQRSAAKALGLDLGIFARGSDATGFLGSGGNVRNFPATLGTSPAPLPLISPEGFGVLGLIGGADPGRALGQHGPVPGRQGSPDRERR